MKLKIGLVTGEYPPMQGGVGAFSSQLASALAHDGHKIHVITDKKARPDNLSRSLWEAKEPYETDYGFLHPVVNRWWWTSVSQIANVANRYDLDLINLQYQAAAYDMRFPAINFLPWRLRELCKTVVTFHDLRVPYLFPKAGRLRSSVVNRLARTADGVIATNGPDHQSLIDLGISAKALRLIPIGSNVKVRISADSEVVTVRRKLGLTKDQRLLGYFGFLNKSKGADILLQAMSRLDQDTHLVFIGGHKGDSDPKNNQVYLEKIEELIEQFGLRSRVHWSGFLPQPDVSKYLCAADMMVMPYRDGVSLRRGTLMAILAHARPLITTIPETPVPGLNHGQNVWLTPVDDPVALAQAIQMLARKPELQADLGHEAGQTASQYSWPKIAKQAASFFGDIVDSEN